MSIHAVRVIEADGHSGTIYRTQSGRPVSFARNDGYRMRVRLFLEKPWRNQPMYDVAVEGAARMGAFVLGRICTGEIVDVRSVAYLSV